MGRQHLGDGPGLAAVLGDIPAGLRRDPWQRQAEQRESKQPGLGLGIALDRGPARQGEQQQHQKAGGNHHAEGPEQAEHVGYGVQRGELDLLLAGIDHIGGVLLQQQPVAQVLLDLIERGDGRG